METIVDLTDVDKTGNDKFVTYDLSDSDVEITVQSNEENAIQHLIDELIAICINLENSRGMTRILQKIFMSNYKRADAQFKNSKKFKRALIRAIKLLKCEPQHKFSHIKDLCNILISSNNTKHMSENNESGVIHSRNRKRKRENSIALTNLPVILLDDPNVISESQNMQKKSISNIQHALISDLENEIQVIDSYNINGDTQSGANNNETLNTKQIHKEEECKVNKNVIPILNTIGNIRAKDNCHSINENGITILNTDLINGLSISLTTKGIENKQEDVTENIIESVSQVTDPRKGQQSQINNIASTSCFDINKENENDYVCNNQSEPNEYLVPQISIDYIDHKNNIDINKILYIESQIAKYNDIINMLEEKEVTTDNVASAYIQSEKYKAKIVSLYKELCNLTGNQPLKPNPVRLTKLEGRPKGPLKRLERFINNNIKSDGVLYFPDFEDVITCVTLSNIEDKLGWSKNEVKAEARVLFKQCGGMLQKLRKRREWRFLLDRVKKEDFENDPADRDPELLARLEANRLHAVTKEVNILNRYTLMQERNRRPEKASSIVRVSPRRLGTNEAGNQSMFYENASNRTNNKELDNTNAKNRIQVINSKEREVDKNRCDINEGIQNMEAKVLILDEEMDTSVNEISLINQLNNSNEFNNNNIIEKVNVNREAEESILKQLNELGDNCTITVMEIYD